MDDASMRHTKRLEESLNDLRTEIQALDSDQEDTRRRLDRLLHDIETTLGGETHAAVDEGLAAQLKTSIVNFEASHPRLAAVMNEVAEKLGTMGI
jgi:response regulator of citrate/malate metabolism